MINKIKKMKGFTLVELLIVIALIAILSVAVLATINPIEQANKARDSRVQNDAAEVMNGYERYYASQQAYPWEYFTGGTPIGAAAAVGLRSDTYGFGICSGAATTAALQAASATGAAADCDASDDVPNLLISSSELKSSFAGKDEFESVRLGTFVQNALWTAKEANGNSIYVCYVPKANANRIDSTKMRCLNTSNGVVNKVGEGTCTATVADWDVPVVDGTSAMFRCVPE